MEKKGFNFLVGLATLWIIWQLNSNGWLHRIGFMAVSYASGQELLYLDVQCVEVFNQGNMFRYSANDLNYSVTPLAAFASLVIDFIAIIGSLTIMLLTGLWDGLVYLSEYLKDLFVLLKDRLDEYKKKSTEETKEEEKQEIINIESKPSVLEVVLLSIKELQEKFQSLELKIKDGEKR